MDSAVANTVVNAHLMESLAFCKDRGLNVIPLNITKNVIGRWKQYQTTRTTPAEWDAWVRNGREGKKEDGTFGLIPVANWGVTTGVLSGVVVIDSDDAAAEAWCAANLPDTPWKVKTRSGFHRYYQHPGDREYPNRKPNHQRDGQLAIDVRGDGGQVVAPWSIHKSGAVYEPVGDWTVGLDAIPVYDPAWLHAVLPKPAELVAVDLPADLTGDKAQQAARYMDKVPGITKGDRTKPGGRAGAAYKLANTLMVSFDLDPGTAHDFLTAWNARNSPPLMPGELDAQFQGARTRPFGTRGDKLRTSRNTDYTLKMEPPVFTATSPEAQRPAPTAKPSRALTRSALKALRPAPWMVKDLIIDKTMTGLIAPPGTYKTFVALDLGLSVASRKSEWLGHKLYVGGPVVYVIGEGGHRWGVRVDAWERRHGPVPDNFITYLQAVQLLDETAVRDFVTDIDALCPDEKPVLVIFDTLSRCLAGADENQQKDMSLAIARCDAIRQHWDCAVMVLHHTNKDGKVERGSSVIRGALDQQLMLVAKSDSTFELETNKAKDAGKADNLLLARDVVETGETDPQTGEPYHSCVIRLATHAERDASKGPDEKDDALLEKAQRWLSTHRDATPDSLARYLGGRKATTLGRIRSWEAEGDIATLRCRTPYRSPNSLDIH